ncbi:MAG: MarR family winged helix-turn-helix transcriptional regulator [Thermodesulfobacteriota bacterium]|nr:MarR family winged helix-turn-helix transcriptional regulator [Thermodesulfobacteriota bacterium]
MQEKGQDRRIFFLMYRAQRKLQKMANKVFAESLGVSAAQTAALFFLMNNDGCLLKELSAGLDLNNSAITGLVNRMEKAGLIKKKKCPEDGRAFRLLMTQKAKNLIPRAFSLLQEANRLLVNDLSETEINTIVRFLNGIIAFNESDLKLDGDIDA